jgi:hypothetical protein
MESKKPDQNSGLSQPSSNHEILAQCQSIDRGALEQTIDSVIGQIPTIARAARDPSFKSLLQIKEGNDFVLGLAWGKIYTEFVAYLLATRGRTYDDKEGQKIAQIITRRSAEIRDAIFNNG